MIKVSFMCVNTLYNYMGFITISIGASENKYTYIGG